MPRVSVLIPSYNCEDYVQAAIDSVMTQTYTDYESTVAYLGPTEALRLAGGARHLGVRSTGGVFSVYAQILLGRQISAPLPHGQRANRVYS